MYWRIFITIWRCWIVLHCSLKWERAVIFAHIVSGINIFPAAITQHSQLLIRISVENRLCDTDDNLYRTCYGKNQADPAKQIQQLYLTVIRADSSMFTVCFNCVVLKFYKYYDKMLQPVISLTYTCVLGRFWQLCGCFCMQSSTQRNNERIFHSVKLFSWWKH